MNQYSKPEVFEGYHYTTSEPEKSARDTNEIGETKVSAVTNCSKEDKLVIER